jgi:ketosteroid isomerase-like protein
MTPQIAQQEIETAYAKYFEALKARDAAGMAAFIAADFQWTTPEGETLDAAQAHRILEEQVQAFVSVESAHQEISQFTLNGNEATFVVTEHISGTIQEDGQNKRILSIDTFRDTMQKTQSGWQFTRAETLHSEVHPA